MKKTSYYKINSRSHTKSLTYRPYHIEKPSSYSSRSSTLPTLAKEHHRCHLLSTNQCNISLNLQILLKHDLICSFIKITISTLKRTYMFMINDTALSPAASPQAVKSCCRFLTKRANLHFFSSHTCLTLSNAH